MDYVKKIYEKFTSIGGMDPPNNEQKEAVKAAMFRPFALIQGPPGTGKTVTVVRLAALYVFVNETLDSTYWKNNIKPQVMICGPSNKSVEVITGKTALSFITTNQANQVETLVRATGPFDLCNLSVTLKEHAHLLVIIELTSICK